jgi:hypothetical protein
LGKSDEGYDFKATSPDAKLVIVDVKLYRTRIISRELHHCRHAASQTSVRNAALGRRQALAHAKAIGATLVFAKLDRFTRNVDLLRSLVASDVDLVFCDLPHVPPAAMGRFLLTQMASVAELEAGLISERTKAALRQTTVPRLIKPARGHDGGSIDPRHLGRLKSQALPRLPVGDCVPGFTRRACSPRSGAHRARKKEGPEG